MADDYIPNLDAYFARIGWAGSRMVSVETLHAISAHHAAAIPFENLDVLAGKGISIAPEAVEQKLVHERRGGYCFEQNQLLLLVLRAQFNGFNVLKAWQVILEVLRGHGPSGPPGDVTNAALGNAISGTINKTTRSRRPRWTCLLLIPMWRCCGRS